eukprot:COSAG02_NODE_1998_length_10148_cov_30.517663_4_plen_118_part_00
MVLRCDGTTIAFVNCHLTAGKGKAGSSKKRVGQYGTVVDTLGRKLGVPDKSKLGKQKSVKNDQQVRSSVLNRDVFARAGIVEGVVLISINAMCVLVVWQILQSGFELHTLFSHVVWM